MIFTQAEKEQLARQAQAEACSLEHNTQQGGKGKPFWNVQAFAFIYSPSFEFCGLPHIESYVFEAEDEEGRCYCFEANAPTANLYPIWGQLPCGNIKLKVYALSLDGNTRIQIGFRSFYKLASFPANLPEKARPYGEAAKLAFDYALSQSFIRHWAEEGTPDPDYDLNVYPSKMIHALIMAMLSFAQVSPQSKSYAIKIAVHAADYLLSISFPEGAALEGLPPTYQPDFRPKGLERDTTCAKDRCHTIMMIYPAGAGSAYLALEEASGEQKYLDAALKIGAFYRKRVLENGSWPLVLLCKDGRVASNAVCDPLNLIVPFLMALYKRTGDEGWRTLSEGAIAYVEHTMLPRYDWEGQFEDSFISENYSNLAHYGACNLAEYYLKYHAEDPAKQKIAEQLIRFAEDQFVVWQKACPFSEPYFDATQFYTPCAMEQYAWHVPIDASTARLSEAFLQMYRASGDRLWLAKATALADAITRVQRADGLIPTHWMNKEHLEGKNFWMNCHFATAATLARLDHFLQENGLH